MPVQTIRGSTWASAKTSGRRGGSGEILRLGLDKKQMCFDGDTSRHYHLVCRSCGAVEDILPGDMGNVEKELESKLTGRIQSVSVNFSGYCEKCASRAKREALLS